MTASELPARIFFAYFAAFFLLALANWLGVSFGEPALDQILYHLHYSADLGIDIGRIFVFTFLAECIGFPLLLAAGAAALQLLILQWMAKRQLLRGQKILAVITPAAAVACGVTALMLKLSLFSWIGYRFAEDYFGKAYVDPARVQLKSGKLDNLVLVYVESLENTYGDASIWGRDLLSPMNDLGGQTFDDYRSVPGTTWTTAGMVASQCGVPLRYASQSDLREGKSAEPTFLPGAICLGDILHAQGYRNVFLGGAPLEFAGKGQFLRDHHYEVRYGRDAWQKKGLDPMEFGEWGLFDDALFAQAKIKLKQLHDSGQRFNLTLLTLDTHNPYGFRSPTCRERGIKAFEDIVECTSHQVADFAKFIRDSGYLNDTRVVIVGDHLAVSNAVYDILRQAPRRRIFNRFISDQPVLKNTDQIVAFDLFPSILEFVGFDVVGDRLGLGYSAFNAQHVPRPSTHLAEVALPSLSASPSYSRLWQGQ